MPNQPKKKATKTTVTTVTTGGGNTKPTRNKKKKSTIKNFLQVNDGDFKRYLKVLSNPWSNSPVRLGGTSCHTGLITQRIRSVVVMAGIKNDTSATNQTSTISVILAPFVAVPIVFAGFENANGTGDYQYIALTGSTAVPSVSTIQANSVSARPIAAGLRLQLLASTSNDQGQAVAVCQGTGVLFEKTNASTWFEEDEKYVGYARDGVWANWRPQDNNSFRFLNTTVSGAGITPQSATYTTTDYPTIGCAFTGMSTATPPNVIVEAIIHWEVILAPAGIGIVETAQGTLTEAHQQSAVTGSFIKDIGSEFGSWLKPVYEGINGTIQTGLTNGASYLAARGIANGVSRALPLLM